jgi:hypothetical protein
VVEVVVLVVVVVLEALAGLPGCFSAVHAAARSARLATIPEQTTVLRFIREKGLGATRSAVFDIVGREARRSMGYFNWIASPSGSVSVSSRLQAQPRRTARTDIRLLPDGSPPRSRDKVACVRLRSANRVPVEQQQR